MTEAGLTREIVAKAYRDKTVLQLPPGMVEVDQMIDIKSGCVMQGHGSHDPSGSFQGSQLIPATGYMGALVGSTSEPHNIALRDFSVRYGKTTGILFDKWVYGSLRVDNVATYSCIGNGMHIRGCPALNIGTYSAYDNSSAGLSVGNIYSGVIGMLAGDNNRSLMKTDSNNMTSIIIHGFRSERWTENYGHNDIFDLTMRGGSLQIMTGSVHVDALNGNAWIHARDSMNLSIGHITYTKPDSGYDFAYVNDKTGERFTATQIGRRPFFTGDATRYGRVYQ